MVLKIVFLFFIVGVQFLLFNEVVGQTPKFRILAPEFVCPKDEETPVDKPDNTIITIQTAAGAKFDLQWKVRWTPLLKPSQRFTLLLWRTVRVLEAKLNAPQPEPFVYVIENEEVTFVNELLVGVDYQFTVSELEATGGLGAPKTFHIDNTQGDVKLNEIDGRGDLLSLVLVGGQEAYADVPYVLEAMVIACYPTQDYYFIWTVNEHNTDSELSVDVSNINGARLEVPPHSLKAGFEYYVNCQVVKQSTGTRVTQTGLHFGVLQRPLQVHLNVDYLIVTAGQPFFIEAISDYNDQQPVEYEWKCIIAEVQCDFFESTDNGTLMFPRGVPDTALYELVVLIRVSGQSASANATIEGVQSSLPVIQISPAPRVLNEGTAVTLVANASNVAPTCTLAWYFATKEYMMGGDYLFNDTCDGCQHGEAVSDVLTIYSLEENFLNELTDFTNETEWRQVTATLPASAGRARFVAQCGCSLTFECETLGTAYADVSFELNESPKTNDILVSPDSGTALETVFRLSTLAVVDPEPPLKYSFYCQVGNDDFLLLASFTEHLAVETVLPYTEGGTSVWVEVCDVLGACSTSEPVVINLSKGTASTLNMIIEEARAQARRCEIIALRRAAVSAIITYTNADQQEALASFKAALSEALAAVDTTCIQRQRGPFSEFLGWLSNHDIIFK